MNLNEVAADFELPDLTGVRHRMSEARGRIAIVNFWSAECPHSERTDRELLECLEAWGDDVQLLPVASNALEGVELLDRAARARGLPLLLLDTDQQVADLFEVKTTPHVFLVDAQGVLRYRGAIDDVSFGKRTASRWFLREAVEAVRASRLPAVQETAAFGCAISR
jgi:peroxiredoxin